MKVKMKDIAELAGVSPATVSLVLNNKPSRISLSTQEHIRSIARELAIKNGSGTMTEGTGIKTIGFVLPDNRNYFFNMLADGLNNYISSQGYTVFQCCSQNNSEKCIKAVEDLIIKNTDGIVVVPPYEINDNQDNINLRKCVEKSPIPIVLLDQAVYNLFTDFVTADNKQGGYLAAKHLLDLGHKKVGCILGPKQNYTTRKRLEGYKRALAESELPFDEKLVQYSGYDMKSGEKAAEILVKEGVSAIFATNDLLAAGVYKYAEKDHIKIPDQLSVVGYDNTIICDLLAAKLTSIEQSADSMGAKAGEVLLGRIKGTSEEEAPRNYYFSPILVERESTAKV